MHGPYFTYRSIEELEWASTSAPKKQAFRKTPLPESCSREVGLDWVELSRPESHDITLAAIFAHTEQRLDHDGKSGLSVVVYQQCYITRR